MDFEPPKTVVLPVRFSQSGVEAYEAGYKEGAWIGSPFWKNPAIEKKEHIPLGKPADYCLLDELESNYFMNLMSLDDDIRKEDDVNMQRDSAYFVGLIFDSAAQDALDVRELAFDKPTEKSKLERYIDIFYEPILDEGRLFVKVYCKKADFERYCLGITSERDYMSLSRDNP